MTMINKDLKVSTENEGTIATPISDVPEGFKLVVICLFGRTKEQRDQKEIQIDSLTKLVLYVLMSERLCG